MGRYFNINAVFGLLINFNELDEKIIEYIDSDLYEKCITTENDVKYKGEKSNYGIINLENWINIYSYQCNSSNNAIEFIDKIDTPIGFIGCDFLIDEIKKIKKITNNDIKKHIKTKLNIIVTVSDENKNRIIDNYNAKESNGKIYINQESKCFTDYEILQSFEFDFDSMSENFFDITDSYKLPIDEYKNNFIKEEINRTSNNIQNNINESGNAQLSSIINRVNTYNEMIERYAKIIKKIRNNMILSWILSQVDIEKSIGSYIISYYSQK